MNSSSDSYIGDLANSKLEYDKSLNWHFFKDTEIIKNLETSKILDIFRFQFNGQESLEKMHGIFSGYNKYKQCTINNIDGLCYLLTSNLYLNKGDNVFDISRSDYKYPEYEFIFVFKNSGYVYVVEYKSLLSRNTRVSKDQFTPNLFSEKEITDAIPADYYIDMEKSKNFITPFLTYAFQCSS